MFKNNEKLYTEDSAEDYTEDFVENISINYLTNDVSYGIILVSTNNKHNNGGQQYDSERKRFGSL